MADKNSCSDLWRFSNAPNRQHSRLRGTETKISVRMEAMAMKILTTVNDSRCETKHDFFLDCKKSILIGGRGHRWPLVDDKPNAIVNVKYRSVPTYYFN